MVCGCVRRRIWKGRSTVWGWTATSSRSIRGRGKPRGPGAGCRGGHEAMGQPVTPELMTSRPVEGAAGELVSLEAVGNYALLPVWADGHRYGIYSWDMLRRLCPCGRHGQE